MRLGMRYMQHLVTFGSYWNFFFSCAAARISTASVYVRLERETALFHNIRNLVRQSKGLLNCLNGCSRLRNTER